MLGLILPARLPLWSPSLHRDVTFFLLSPMFSLHPSIHPFAPTGLQLSVQARSDVIKRSTKALRQLGEKSRKRGGDGSREQEGAGSTGMTFDEALAHLQQSQAHLETLSQDFVLSLGDGQQVWPACFPPRGRSAFNVFSSVINSSKWTGS